MIENIDLTKTPHSSGVYLFKDENGVVIYVGSSKDLYQRFKQHRHCIKEGGNQGGTTQKGFYDFLKTNEFKAEFESTGEYLMVEQKLIDMYKPSFNQKAAHTGLTRNAYLKNFYESHKEEKKAYEKARYETTKEEKKQKTKQRDSQSCCYHGEILTLNALRKRFQRQGIPHPTLEAKKYLITTN